MLRRFCMACLLLLGGWSSAVAQEPTRYVPQVGQVYQLREHILVALSPLYVEDLIKALRAKDMDGIRRMVEDGQVGGLPAQSRLRVLEVHPAGLTNRLPYVEVRPRYQNRTLSTVYVLQAYFTSKFMQPVEE